MITLCKLRRSEIPGEVSNRSEPLFLHAVDARPGRHSDGCGETQRPKRKRGKTWRTAFANEGCSCEESLLITNAFGRTSQIGDRLGYCATAVGVGTRGSAHLDRPPTQNPVPISAASAISIIHCRVECRNNWRGKQSPRVYVCIAHVGNAKKHAHANSTPQSRILSGSPRSSQLSE